MPTFPSFATQTPKTWLRSNLYRPAGLEAPEGIRLLFTGTVDSGTDQRSNGMAWSGPRSLKNRHRARPCVAKRLVQPLQCNRLAKALTAAGRLVQNDLPAGFIDDRELRGLVVTAEIEANSARSLPAIPSCNQGEFRSGDYFEIMNKASCLSLRRTPSCSTTPFTSAIFLSRLKRPVGCSRPRLLPTSALCCLTISLSTGQYDFSAPPEQIDKLDV